LKVSVQKDKCAIKIRSLINLAEVDIRQDKQLLTCVPDPNIILCGMA
jgi:hypothetical protein